MRWVLKKLLSGESGRNRGTVLISSWKCNYSIYLDIQVYYMDIQAICKHLCLLSILDVLVPSIDSFFYNTTALLKINVFRHSKAYSSTSFGPTTMGIGMKWVSKKDSAYIFSDRLFFNKFIKFLFFSKDSCDVQKIIYNLFWKINEQRDILVHTKSC